MKRNTLLAVLFAAATAGCDYTVPLIEKPDSPIDPALVGLWEKPAGDENAGQQLLVLPLSKNEYLIAFPAGSKDALYASATPCKAAGLALLQLKWFGTARGATAEDGRVYQFASFSVTGETLKGRLLNADVVDRNAASTAALLAAIEANAEDPKLFRDVWTFTKVKVPQDPNQPLKRPPMPAAWQ